jgi:Icc-related predicted phosphoesterase
VRVCCIGDFHGRLPPPVPPCDLLLVAGDIGPDEPEAAEAWLRTGLGPWLEAQPAREIVAVAGNHDLLAAADPSSFRTAAPWRYLDNESAVVAGARLAGSAWSLPFGHWPFMAEEDVLAGIWQRIPEDTEILLVHGPPYGCCDATARGVRGGSLTLLRRVTELPDLRLVCCGHIHEGYGRETLWTGALVVNASLVDLSVELANEPVVIDL